MLGAKSKRMFSAHKSVSQGLNAKNLGRSQGACCNWHMNQVTADQLLSPKMLFWFVRRASRSSKGGDGGCSHSHQKARRGGKARAYIAGQQH